MVEHLTKLRRAGAVQCAKAYINNQASIGSSKVVIEFDNEDSAQHVCNWLLETYNINAELVRPTNSVYFCNYYFKVKFNI